MCVAVFRLLCFVPNAVSSDTQFADQWLYPVPPHPGILLPDKSNLLTDSGKSAMNF